jgi:glycosyltransferase involved in cell wall biosynthesis
VDNHNAESRLYDRIAKSASGLQRIKASITRWNMRQMESYLPAASKLWAVSEEDRQFFTSFVDDSRISMIPNVVDAAAYEGVDAAERPRSIAYVGSYGYAPNQQAALALIAISKRLKREGVDHELWIVGNSPVPEMYRAAEGETQITITGFVPDTRDYVARASLVVAPLREGSGTKFKLLEAMALGRPILTTPMGAEGMGVQPNKDMVIVQDETGFVAQTKALLDDPDRRRAIGEAARRKVVEQFSMSVLVDQIRTSLATPA